MIIAQSTAIRQIVADYQQFKELATRQDAIQATTAALDELHKAIAPLAIYPQLRPYLAPTEVVGIQQMAQRLVANLAALQRNFASQLEQRSRIERERENAEQLKHRMAQAWRAFAQPLLDEVRKQYELVEHLPRIQRNATTFQQELRKLQQVAAILPNRSTTLSQFLNDLDRLRSQLHVVGGLTTAQQQFLESVNRGTATLADVTPELLVWAKNQGMDHQLKLTL